MTKWTIQWASAWGTHYDKFDTEKLARDAWHYRYLPENMYWAELVNPEGEVIASR